MIRILDRYVLREFLNYLIMGLLLFVGLFVIVDVFEKIDTFVDNEARPTDIIAYYLNSIPYIVVLTGPIAMLLACLLALGQIGRTGELVSMLAAGVSYFRILVPILAFSILASVASFVLGEWVMPEASVRKETIYQEKIKGRSQSVQARKRNVTYMGYGNRLFYVKTVDPTRRVLRDLVVQQLDENHDLVFRIDAREATQDGDAWVFRSGFVRRVNHDGEVVVPFRNYWLTSIPETIDDFLQTEPDPMAMGRTGLGHYIERLRESGARTRKYEVEYHLKLAFPLINLIIVFLGASLSARIRRSGFALGFGLSIFLGFSYYAFVRTGQAIGYNGTVPPILSAWMGNLIFLAVGVVFQVRANR